MEANYRKYQEALQLKEKEWESLCKRCGGCCGAYDDPCRHLKKRIRGEFYCQIYNRRFGTHTTLDGEEFECVFVKEILDSYWKKDHLCVYKKYRKTPWKELDS